MSTAAVRTPTAGRRPRADLRRRALEHAPILGPAGALVLMFALFAILAPSSFVSSDNLFNLLAQMAVLAVLATGVTYVLLLGEIDLGFANIAILSGIAATLFFGGKDIDIPFVGQLYMGSGTGDQIVGIATVLVIAAALGWVSGALTAKLGVPSFVGSLGILLLAQGWAFYWSQGENQYTVPSLAKTIGSGYVGPVPRVAISAAVILLLAHLVLSRTRFGRYVYMTGANKDAAELSGIPTKRIVMMVFALAGLLAGIAGLMNIGRLGSAQPDAGTELLLPAIAAVVLGGTSLFGGRGGIGYTVIGLLLYGVIDNGLDQLDIDPYIKPFVRGLLFLTAIALNVLMLRIARRAQAQSLLERSAEPPDPTPAAPSAPAPSTDRQPSATR
jgi:ribose transport system permease protein